MDIKHKLLILYLKYTPSLIAVIYLIGTILSYFSIDTMLLSWIGFTSFIPLLFLLLSSYVFKFCLWHRLPIYYIMFCNTINFIGWSFSTVLLPSITLWISIITFGVTFILMAYLKNKCNEKDRRNEGVTPRSYKEYRCWKF